VPFGEEPIGIEQLGEVAGAVRDVIENGHTRMITNQGVVVAAIVDVQTYDALRTAAANDLLRDLQEAIAEVDAGRVVDHADVMREIRSLFEGRVSPAELEAFDRA
jgi:hypothetical protein